MKIRRLNRMYKNQLTFLAILVFLMALVLTGLGGWSDMLGKPFVVTKQHAWNDGLFLLGVAIFLLLLSRI
jgi:thiol:disulfide interchange protein